MDQYHDQQQIEAICNSLKDFLSDQYAAEDLGPLYIPQDRAKLFERFNEPDAPREGMDFERVFDFFKQEIYPYSPRTWHPAFMNQMTTGSCFLSLIGDALTGVMNPTLATCEAAPVATIIENNLAAWMAKTLGMAEGSGGIFLPGGSITNMVALALARFRSLGPDVALNGLQESGPVALICSEASHYSIANAANFLGIGLKNVIKARSKPGRLEMDAQDLREKVATCKQEGRTIIAVVATTGLTVTGGFDPLEEIAQVCREHDIHLHVDAAFGGCMAFAKSGKQLFKGMEYADTVTWDAHKSLHAPLTCSALLLPNPVILKQAFASNANYLFHEEEDTPVMDDLGQYTIMCGKRFDALTIWFLWKTYGTAYYEALSEDRLETTIAAHDFLDQDPDFEPSYQPVSPVLCFRFSQKVLQGKSIEQQNKLHQAARKAVRLSGKGIYNITTIGEQDHFRAMFINPLTTLDSFKMLIEETRKALSALESI